MRVVDLEPAFNFQLNAIDMDRPIAGTESEGGCRPQAVTGFKPEHSQTQEEKDQEQHWHAVDDLRP